VDLDDGIGTQVRFEEYTASLAAVLGHADRVRPFADYCVGLLSAEGRKSVEPLAAVTAPERTAAQHQSLLHFVAQAPWSDQAMLRCANVSCHPSRVTNRSRRGSSTTQAFPRRVATRSAWPGSIAVSWASRTTARWRSVFQWRPIREAYLLPTGCIYRRSGPTMRHDGLSPAFRMMSASRPSPRSRCCCCAGAGGWCATGAGGDGPGLWQ
jgi:hypothetical protein